MSCTSVGNFTKIAAEDTGGTFDDSSFRFPIIAETLTLDEPFQGFNRAITGDSSQHASRVRKHSGKVQGQIVTQPGPAEMTTWLPWAMGDPTVGNLGTTYVAKDFLISTEAQDFLYTGCKCSQQIWESRTEAGADPSDEELILCTNNVLGLDESYATAWPDPEPTIGNTAAFAPYIHSEGVLNFNSNATPFKSWRLIINNMMRHIFNDGSRADCIRSMGRVIMLQIVNPFTADTWTDARAALNAGVPATLTFTNGNMSTVFTFASLRNRYRRPGTRGRGEIPQTLDLVAFKTDAAAELVVTHDDNPAA